MTNEELTIFVDGFHKRVDLNKLYEQHGNAFREQRGAHEMAEMLQWINDIESTGEHDTPEVCFDMLVRPLVDHAGFILEHDISGGYRDAFVEKMHKVKDVIGLLHHTYCEDPEGYG